MVELFLNNRWSFLILAETVFWITVMTALTLRYWFNKPKAAVVVFLFTLVNEIWILFLGILDIKDTGELSTFQIIIVIIILYSLILGKYDLRKLDRFLFRSVARLKGTKIIEETKNNELFGISKAKEEIKQFCLHCLLFLLAHVVFLLVLFFMSKETRTDSLMNQIAWLYSQFQNNKVLIQVSKVWSVILLIDGIRSISYLIFPKKEIEKKNY